MPPIDLSTTYPIDDLAVGTRSLEELAAGRPEAANPVYSRLYNPTVHGFERGLAQLERASDAVAFSSGMAATTACLLAARRDGSHVVAVRPLYGGVDHLLTSGLLPFEVTFARPGEVAAAIREETALVLCETPGNPTLELIDVADLARQAGEVPLLVDSTFATPVLQQPLTHGATLVVHSATKYLGGHGDVLGGVVACGEEWAARLRQVRVLTGGVLHPLAGYLLHRGLQTLPLRVERAQASASLLAERLATHPSVTRVLYPGLPGGDPEGLVGRQMAGPGCVLSFEVEGGYEAAAAVSRSLEMVTQAVSLGSAETLIQHPAGLTHRLVDPEALAQQGITQGLLRLSVGLEGAEDLWADLDRALGHAGRGARPRLAVATG